MALELLQAMLVGVIAALPVGPILLMVIQRTLCFDRRSGMMVGLGAAAADTILAAVGLLTLELIQGFIQAHMVVFLLVGAVVLAVVGVGIFTRELPVPLPGEERQVSYWLCWWQAFLTTLTNPAALAIIMTLLAAFGLVSGGFSAPAWLLILMVGAGESLYWFTMTFLLSHYLHISGRTLRRGSKMAGALICLFAVVLLIRGLVMIIM